MRPLYVRLPDDAAEKLHRAAFELGLPKQDIVTNLLQDHLTVGKAEFFPNEEQAVLTLEEAAELLRIEPKQMRKLAANGDVPGRKVINEWRFSRAALLNWLSANDNDNEEA
jgi:excisionase family DNA binding protein